MTTTMRKGRPRALTPGGRECLIRMIRDEGFTWEGAAAQLGISPATVGRVLAEHRAADPDRRSRSFESMGTKR